MAIFEYRQAEEIRDAFAKHGVRYLFIGKSGAILLGYPDTTQDADVYVERSAVNCLEGEVETLTKTPVRYLLVFALLFCFSARAQESTALSPVIPITERERPSTIPIPYGSPTKWKLLRSYTAPVGENGEMVWLFAFGRKPLNYPKFPLDDIDWLDVNFVVAKPLKKSIGRWFVLRRVPLGLRQRHVSSELQLRWLRPGEKTGPVLVLDAPLDQKSELLVFPLGWSQKSAVRQAFQVWNSASQNGSYRFDSLDESGTLLVAEVIYNYADGNATKGDDIPHHWNGSGWNE